MKARTTIQPKILCIEFAFFKTTSSVFALNVTGYPVSIPFPVVFGLISGRSKLLQISGIASAINNAANQFSLSSEASIEVMNLSIDHLYLLGDYL